jgi:hypothetical protein
MASVNFDAEVGGDGSTVTDDSNPTTGLGQDGHRARLVPALVQFIAVASWVKNKAILTKAYADRASSALSQVAVSASLASTYKDLAKSYTEAGLINEANSHNSAAASSSSASAASLALLALSDVLSNGIGAFSVDADGDLNVSYNESTVTNITINSSGELIVTY